MTEKVLGFKEKDAQCTKYSFSIKELSETFGFKPKNNYVVFEDELVPVWLKSESITLEALKKYCEEEIRRCYGDPEFDKIEIDTLTKIQEWAKKEAEKTK